MKHRLVTKCPKCGATCLIGSDEDFMVYCAHCRTSFKIENEELMSIEEYRERRKKSNEYFVSSGWEAFYTPPETAENKKVEE